MFIRIGTKEYHITIELFYIYDGIDRFLINFFALSISQKFIAIVINNKRPFFHISRNGQHLFSQGN